MFLRIAGFEFRYQIRSPVFWAAGLVFFLLAFAATTVPQIQLGSRGPMHVNAPVAILQLVGIMGVLFVFAITAFVANIVVRDDETGFGPLIRSTPIAKFDYLMGRFSGAFGASAILALTMPLGILVGTFMPGGDPVKLGPFRPDDYVYAYFVVVVPTVLILSASFFALATATRSMMATYLGAVAFLIGYFVLITLFQKPIYGPLVGLLEPFGIGAIREATKYWTTAERDTTLPPLFGVILLNRAIWFAVSLALLAVAYVSYRFEARGARTSRPQKKDTSVPPVSSRPLPAPRFDRVSLFAMGWRWTRLEMAQVFKSPAFFVLLVLGLLNALSSLVTATDRNYFTVLPVTILMIQTLNLEFAIIPTIVAIYYAGELVWRERERRMHEIFDASPVPDWALVIPKIAAIALVLIALFAISVLAAAGTQALKGYTNFEWSHYLDWYLVPNAIGAIQLAALAIFVQALSPHKYIGWGVMALILIALLALPGMGFEHHLYLYGTSPDAPLSDMNGQGRFWVARAWFEVYWSGFALMLAVLASVLWRRGAETRLRPDSLACRDGWRAGQALSWPLAWPFGRGAARSSITTPTFSMRTAPASNRTCGSPIMRRLSTNFTTSHRHGSPMSRSMPRFIRTTRRIITTGRFTIRNKSDKPLREVHLRWARDLKVDRLTVEGAHVKQRFDRFNYVIYAFDRPMQPGEARAINFHSVWEQKGFKNSGNMTRIVDNGTYADDRQILPIVGMDAYGLLGDPVKRRRYGLPAELRVPKLEDNSARASSYNASAADFVNTDITVSTVADQIPLAPGYRVSDVVRRDRRIARFKSDAPIVYYFSIQSAAYAVKRDRWRDVDLAVYYDPHHPYEIDRMIRAIKASFDVYTKEFGPYQFRQVTFIEFPGYEDFAESYANTVPWSENLGFIQDDRAIEL